MALIQADEHYTYSDYASWDHETRYELINGVPYMLASPSQIHQKIVREISFQLTGFLRDKPCEVFPAPFDVRLNATDGDDIVVQPDLLVVCDKTKLDGKACVGAPDMVIEILSPSSAQKDRFTKYHLYQTAGVHEYWIVDADSQTVQAYILKDGEYVSKVYRDTASVHVLEGCVINLSEVFAE
ncbi:MAG: Uma2 family endonuclease [Peptococcaceae bacterium]|nr:Uma2 family endonuclease [Peptococcaceae bacterium]